MDCPEQLVYNWDVDQCDWPHNLNCTDEGDNSGEGEMTWEMKDFKK